MPSRIMLAGMLTVLTLVALPVTTAQPEPAPQSPPAFTIHIDADGTATIDGDPVLTDLRHSEPGANYTFDLNLTRDHTIAWVRIDDAFPIQRARQLVPEIDDSARPTHPDHLHPHFFTEVSRDVGDVDSPAHIVNLTHHDGAYWIHLGIMGPGPAVLTLTRDVEAPFYQTDEPTSLTHIGFMQVTRTDEFSFATLRIKPAGGDRIVEFPTSLPALEQTFPVQGLKAETEYVYWVDYRDWAHNPSRTENFTITTPAKPIVPAPAIASYWPLPGTTKQHVDDVRVTFRSTTPIVKTGISLFLDKMPIEDAFVVEPVADLAEHYVVRYAPITPLADGLHTVSVDATNRAGGTTTARWSFTVGVPSEDVPAIALGPVLLALAGLAFVGRRN